MRDRFLDLFRRSRRAGAAGRGQPLDPPDYAELKHKLLWRGDGPARGRDLTVHMDQNNRCNLKCKMCGFSDARVGAIPKYDMPRWLFDSIAAQVFPRTNILILSIMTEPFMTRDFPDRLGAVRTFGVPFSEIITNGTLLDERIIAKVLDAEITCLTVSIDGGSKDTYEAIRTGARFENVIANVRLFQAMRGERRAALPQLRINHVLSEPNIDHFDEFLSLVADLLPEKIGVRTVSRMSNAILQESADEGFWAKVRAIRPKLAAFCRQTGIEDTGFLRDRPTPIELFAGGEKLSCRAPWEMLGFLPNGDVYPCIAWTREPIGNIARQSFEAIWNGRVLERVRREFEAVRPGIDCLNCTARRNLTSDPDDDFFFAKIAKQLPAEFSAAGSRTRG